MRRLLIALAISLVPSLALAAHIGGGGGHVGGGHMGVAGGHMSGGWSGAHMGGSGFSSRAAVGTARVRLERRSLDGANWNHGSFRHGRFVHRHGRVFFVGGGPWWVGGYDTCWQWVATPWGLRQTWVCGDYGYY